MTDMGRLERLWTGSKIRYMDRGKIKARIIFKKRNDMVQDRRDAVYWDKLTVFAWMGHTMT